MPLLYGKNYLDASLRSVINHVEKMVILYTDKPSYGFGTSIPNPDSEAELKAIAERVCGDKLIWHKANSGNEGAHRGEIYQYTEGFDICIAIDSDEIFCEEDLAKAIIEVSKGDKRYYGIGGYINLWRSFSYAAFDGYTPIRLTNLHNESGEGVVSCKIWHFSTAQPISTMKYKISVHGHSDEIRKDWFEKTFLAWRPNNENLNKDLHIVAHGLWNACFYDKQQMPEYLKTHPFFNLEIIE